jgi:glycosyltransferase involved in cell wall biosynthesis
VGVVAHLSPEKGHVTVLKAAARLRERFPDVTYVLVGGGERRQLLEERARALNVADRVLFTGFRKDSDAMMREFDVFCLASLSEGLSSAILAAMARPLPVVATRVGGIPELVVDGNTGLLVPAGRPDKLAEALAKVLSSSSLRRRMREAGRRRVAEYFTLDRKLDETERLYLELARLRRPRRRPPGCRPGRVP